MLKRISDTIRFALSAVFHGIIAALYLAILLLTALFSREEDEPIQPRCHCCNVPLKPQNLNLGGHTYCIDCFAKLANIQQDQAAYLERCLSLPSPHKRP